MYPIKNLEDLYDKEGYRDSEFKKGDKGMWTIYTDFAKSNKPGELDDEGMVLNLDRNTRTAKGHYFVTTFYRNGKLPDEKNYKIVKELRSRYNISTEKSPILKMHIDGDLKGSSVGYRKLEIDFSKRENSKLSVIEFLSYKPAKK